MRRVGPVVLVGLVALAYTDIGSTSVERPAWYEAAVTETNASASNRTETLA